MKIYFILAAISGLLFLGCENGGDVKPNSDREKTLYVLGAQMGRGIEEFKLSESDLKFVSQGLKDKAAGKTLVVTPSQEYFEKIKALVEAPLKEKAKGEIDEGKKWLAEAEKTDGAKKQNSGLIYIEKSAGTGKNPTATDFVEVFYRGTLRDGKEFDSNIGKEAIKFPLNGVIPCWTEALQLMKVGGKAEIYCPNEIAYGARGQPPVIPPGAALKFEVELKGIGAPPANDPHAGLEEPKPKKAKK